MASDEGGIIPLLEEEPETQRGHSLDEGHTPLEEEFRLDTRRTCSAPEFFGDAKNSSVKPHPEAPHLLLLCSPNTFLDTQCLVCE